MVDNFMMREACPRCGTLSGYIEIRSGQNCVFCTGCDRHCYNAPKTETGQRQRSVSTVHNGIKPKQRYRVLERASGRCEMCGKDGKESHFGLHVEHLVSVHDGLVIGVADSIINSDENLAAFCDECNLGKGRLSISPRLLVALLLRRLEPNNDQHSFDTAVDSGE